MTMQPSTNTFDMAAIQPCATGFRRAFPAAMAASIRRHRFIFAIALFTLLSAVVVGSVTGNLPNFSVLKEYGFYILVSLWIGCSGFAIVRVLWLALVARDPSPSKAFFTSFAKFFSDPDRIANGINGIGAIMIFVSGFSVLKGAIGILHPFSWDMALAQLGKELHFGYLPYEWLWWLIQSPEGIFAINIAYNFWFVALIATIFSAAIAQRDSLLRHQFLMSFLLAWLIAGVGVAIGFSSAGPCYFDRIGLGSAYQPLMDALAKANEIYPIWALSTQDMLWNGFTGDGAGSIGISAFPSMHVASAVLFALYASRRSFFAGIVMWCFAAIILVGSVVLGWHYALDSYAGVFFAVAIWKITGYALTAERIGLAHERSGRRLPDQPSNMPATSTASAPTMPAIIRFPDRI